MEKDRHKRKFLDFILSPISKIDSPQILEFGVSKKGMSTSIFLDLCKKNSGKLLSVDTNNDSRKFQESNWRFINARDDDYDVIEEYIDRELDVIYLDTIHKADHVEKIIYHYYDKLKVGGFFFVDDTSWLPYLKKNRKDNFFMEMNNHETFDRIVEISNSNNDCFDLEFSFVGTGIARIRKLSNNKLNISNKLKSRKFSIKNLFRKTFIFFRLFNKK